MAETNHKRIGKMSQSPDIDAVKIKTEFNAFGFLKTCWLLLTIFLQFVVLVLSYMYLHELFTWLTIVSVVLSIFTCIYVLSSDKNGLIKGVWIFFLLVCFMFAYMLYFASDEHILFQASKKRYKKIYAKTDKFIDKQHSFEKVDKQVVSDCKYLQNIGKFVAYDSTKMKYYPSGAQMFDDVLDDIKAAKKYIFIEFYIVSDGVLLEKTLKILKEKVDEGVDVRIIYDDMGSHGTFKRKTKRRIKKLGIKLQSYNKMIPVFSMALNFRDHRKFVLVDGKIGYTGGANLADEYVNEKRMYGYWKDTAIRLEGKAVNAFVLAFLRQWEFLTKQSQEYENYLNLSDSFSNKQVVVPFVDGLDYKPAIARDVYINMIANAQEKIWITTPYFIPDETILDLLRNKARSGVDVRIVLPDVADKKYVYIVSRNNAEKLIDSGVKVYTMKHSFVHAKMCLTEYSAVVGSINFDQRSFCQQFESGVYTNDKQVLKDMTKDFNDMYEKSFEITKQNRKSNRLSNRVIAGVFRLASPFM